MAWLKGVLDQSRTACPLQRGDVMISRLLPIILADREHRVRRFGLFHRTFRGGVT